MPLLSGRSSLGSASHFSSPHLPMSVLSSQVTPRPHLSSQSSVASTRGTSDAYALQTNSSVLLATANDHADVSPSKVLDNAKLSLGVQQQRTHAPTHSPLQGPPQPQRASLPTHHTPRFNLQQTSHVQTPPQRGGTGLNGILFANQRVASETTDPSQMYMSTYSPQTTAMPRAEHHSSVNSQYNI